MSLFFSSTSLRWSGIGCHVETPILRAFRYAVYLLLNIRSASAADERTLLPRHLASSLFRSSNARLFWIFASATFRIPLLNKRSSPEKYFSAKGAGRSARYLTQRLPDRKSSLSASLSQMCRTFSTTREKSDS